MTILAEAPAASAVAERLTGRDYVSYSAIATYRQCPLRYYFKYVKNLPEHVVSSGLVFGGAIHGCVEHHFNELMAGNPAPDHDTLLSIFWDSWKNRSEEATVQFGKAEDANTIGHLADRVITTFQQSDLAQPGGSILGVEEELRGEVVAGVPDLLARIDLLVETDDELIVTDFKTSRSRWSAGQAEDSGEQLLLYAELAQRLTPGKAIRLGFSVISKGKSPIAERHPVRADAQRIARTKQVVEHVWKAIEARHFYPAPSPLSCPSCPFREPCRAWPD